MAKKNDKKKTVPAASSVMWRGTTPSQLAQNMQAANKNVKSAQQTKQNTQKQNTVQTAKNSAQAMKSAAPSSVSWRGTPASQIAKPAQQTVVTLPKITPGYVSPSQRHQVNTQKAVQSAKTLAQNDNSLRARISRSHEKERQALAANAAAIKQDKATLAANSLKWHQTTDAATRQQLEQQNAAIRARRGYGYDSRTGSTFDTKGNELSLASRMIYGGKAETAKQFDDVRQTREFLRETGRTVAQPSIYDVARGVKADDPYYALESGRKAHSIVNDLLNRSADTWTDADTKARDESREALQNEMSALFRYYGAEYQPRWSAEQTAAALQRAGADEDTIAYAMENLRLRDSTDRLGQGLEAVGKRFAASIPSLVDTVKQALSNRNEDYDNEEYRSLTEREQALEAQLQNMVSQNADGSVPADYQAVYDELQSIRNQKNAIKTTKGVDPNTWSQTVLREANEAQANAEAGLATAPRWLTEQAISLAGNAPSMAVSALPGGALLGSAFIGAQAAGQRAFELNEQGKSAGEALGRSLVSGAIEAGTEKLPLEQMAEILTSAGTGAVKSILRQMGTEATEEGISYFLNYVSDLAAADPDAKFSLYELAQSAAGGAFGGLVFGTAGAVGSRLTLGKAAPAEYDAESYTRNIESQLQQADAELRTAKSLPEGATRDAAVQRAYQKMSETLDAFTSQKIAENAEVAAQEGVLDFTRSDSIFPQKNNEAQNYSAPHAEGNIRVGRATTIQKPYTGAVPAQTVTAEHTAPLTISENAVDGARQTIAAAEQQPQFRKSIRTVLRSIFDDQGGARTVPVLGLTMDGQQYDVNLNANIAAKVASDVNMSPEKLSAFSQLDTAVSTAQYVGSGEYGKNRAKASNVVRYDYFEKPLNIGGQDYVMSFDVEVYPDRNNFRTYKVINEIDLTPVNALHQSLSGSGVQQESGLSATSIRRNAENSNSLSENSASIMQDAIQYGKTPEQAVTEANAKRKGEQVRAAREQTETDFMKSRLADVWSELTELDARGLRRSDEFRELWDEKNRLNDELAARGEKTGAVLPEIETPQTDSGEHLDPSVFKYPTQAEEMIRVGANAKRTAGDYLDTLKGSRDTTAADSNKQLYRELMDTYEQARPITAKIEQVQKQVQLSLRDKKLLQSALLGGGREVLKNCENQPGAMRLYDLETQKREIMKPVNEYNSRVRMEREMQADEWADCIAEFGTDKKRGLYYITETPERNTYDIFGKKNRAAAEEFNETFYKPVHEGVAEATRLQNRLRKRIADLGLNKHESAMVQMIGEGKKTAALEYADKHGIKLGDADTQHLENAANVFRETYDELFDMINAAEVKNGLEPTLKRANYFPHFTEAAPDTTIARAMWRLGMKITGKETLSTDLAGQTENFRPGHKWERHLQHREGDSTIYDAVKGFDQYIEDISQYIYLTDSIQNLRSLEDAVRYRLSDEGTRAKIDEIKSNYSIDALERRQQMEDVYDATDNRTPFQRAVGALEEQKRAGMRNFVVELRRYTDSLAGKKHRGDRGIEDIVGRDVYEISKNLEGRVAANMISLNPGSWLTNFIPLTQAGEIDTKSLLRGMAQTIRSTVSDDGFVNTSTFLTNRYGSDSISKTTMRKLSDAAGAPMEMIDHFVAESIVRARVAQNLKNHMALDEAFSEADSYAASLMADRSKGATPGAFEMRNPIVKVFTMYQLETNNQLRHFFKDIPRDSAKNSSSKAGAVARTGLALTKIFAGAYIYNKIYHELTGRDAAFDPIGMITEAFGIDPFDDDDDKEKKKPIDVALSLGSSVAENLPFIGGLLGGGRVPISAAIPDVGKLAEEYSGGYDKRRLAQDTIKEAAKPATYLLLPFGGGALNRAVQGAATMKAGGSYSLDKNGEKMLQFPVFGQKPEDWAKAALFGKSSLDTAQNWKENGYDSLYAKETEAFETLRDRMKWRDEDNSEAVYAAIKAMRSISDTYDNSDIAARQIREMLFNNNDLSAEQKDFLDRELVSGGESGDYTSRDAFDISQMVRESRQQAANEAVKHGIEPEVFADWDGRLDDLTKEQNDDGSKKYTTNTALGAVLDEISANTNITSGEREALSDYLLISAMSESDRDKWNDEVKGKVNASDYVRFKSDVTAYKAEFKGSGADNAANIAEILRGYSDLSDEQRGVLMNTYSETASSNPFHVSDTEKKLADNSFYKDLSDSGRATLRTMLNEYEQAVADGKDLSGWKAKAYMAKEAGIEPQTYALFQTALKACDFDGNGSYKSAEITAAVKMIPGLSDKQRGYLWQAAKGGKASKNNPWGTTTVTAYTKQGGDAVNPVDGGTISSGFGPRTSPTEGASSTHKAIDIAAAAGTPVKAAMSGKIVEVTKGYNGDYGNTVSVDHGNGLVTKYHHMQDGSIDGVSVGQEVTAGQQIGKVGSTGISTGPHLDFQVVKDGDFVDPRKYIPGYGSGNDYFYSGSASAGAVAGGKSAAASSGSKKSSGSGSASGSGLKKLKKLPTFK